MYRNRRLLSEALVCRFFHCSITSVREKVGRIGNLNFHANHALRSFRNQSLDTVVTCLPGLEPILSMELTALGIDHKPIQQGASLERTPSVDNIFLSSLYLGSASNILVRCGETFTARGLPELRRKVARLPWPEILQKEVRVEVRVTSRKSKLYHSAAVKGRVLAGVYESMGYDIPNDRFDAIYPPEISDDAPLVRLEVTILRDQVDIFLYASTTPLHRRGYRLQTSKAPLREDLAYAMLYSAGWIPAWDDTAASMHNALLDPMCGSGTIAIEAAAMFAGLPPGRLRKPPLVGTLLEDNDLFENLLTKQLNQTRSNPSSVVFASDRDSGAIEITKSNAERAGVIDLVNIEGGALSSHPLWSEDSKGALLVVTNPPFGKRVSPASSIQATLKNKGDKNLLSLYHKIERLALKRPRTVLMVLAQEIDLVRKLSGRFEEVFTSTHGGLAVSAMRLPPKENVAREQP